MIAFPKKQLFIIGFLAFFFSGCASTLRTAPSFDSTIKTVKTIAVMPPDVKVFKITAGGVTEQIDEWSDQSKKLIEAALKKHLGERYGFEIKFVSEDWLKTNHKDVWTANRALYEAVCLSALLHAYSDINTFPAKLKNFDYTLGEEVQELSSIVQTDALLFVYGFDYEATACRAALWWWNLSLAVLTGSSLLPTNPSMMIVGLVDGKAGDVVWFKTSNPSVEYSFRSEKHIDMLMEWLLKDLVKKK